MKMLAAISVAITLALTGCVIDDSGGDGSSSDPSSGSSAGSSGGSDTYSNHVYLECNGSVLVDRTFTSRAACDDFAAANTFYCGSIKLPVSC